MRIGRPLDPDELATYDMIGAELAARVRIVEVPFLFPGTAGMTVGRFVLVRRNRAHDRRLIAHELVHVRQYDEHGFIGFLWRYLREYFSSLRIHKRHRRAYKAMPLEVEAEQLAKQWHEKPRDGLQGKGVDPRM